MAGIVTFATLSEALREGYEPYERTENGYLMRVRTTLGWAWAFVDMVGN